MRPAPLASLAALTLGAFVACSSSSTSVDPGTSGAGDAGASGTDGGGGSKDSGSTPGADGGSAGAQDYGKDGPHTVTTKSESASNGTSSIAVVVYVPSGVGPFPTVILSSGLQQPALGYAPYAKRLATWGIATITRDDPGALTQSTTIQADIEGLVTKWLPTADGNLYDANKVGLAGHSRGGQVSLLAAENGLLGKNKGLFLLDPVDSSTATVKTKMASLGVPLAMIGETTDSTGGIGGHDCAPAADNYAALYALAATPALAITAVNADHVMFEDPANCSFCTLCVKGTADPAVVLAESTKLMTTFFAKVLLGDASVDATLNTAADVTAGTVTVQSK